MLALSAPVRCAIWLSVTTPVTEQMVVMSAIPYSHTVGLILLVYDGIIVGAAARMCLLAISTMLWRAMWLTKSISQRRRLYYGFIAYAGLR